MSLGSDTQSGFDSSVDSSVDVNTLQAEPLESQGLFPRRGRVFSLFSAACRMTVKTTYPLIQRVLATLTLRESSLA